MARFEELICGFARIVTPTQTLSVIHEDPDDDRVLECAVASGSDMIVTGDEDLLRRGSYEALGS